MSPAQAAAARAALPVTSKASAARAAAALDGVPRGRPTVGDRWREDCAASAAKALENIGVAPIPGDPLGPEDEASLIGQALHDAGGSYDPRAIALLQTLAARAGHPSSR
jgi:hypothetical protein